MAQAKDYEADLDAPDAAQVQKVIELARQMRRAEMKVDDLQGQLEKAEAELTKLAQYDVPEAMSAAGMKTMPLGNGYEIEVRTVVSNGSLQTAPESPEEIERYKKAFAWLEKHGHADLIKHSVIVLFPKEEQAWFRKFCQDLRKRKRPLDATAKDYVHSQTLKAFIAEHLGDPMFPRELFKVYEQKQAFIVPPKGAERPARRKRK